MLDRLTRNQLVLLAGLGSAALLAGAYGFQYIGGMAPCQLCLWQRWPHRAAVAFMVLALLLPGRALPLLGALSALATAGIGMFHVGVEQKWWEGLASCTAGSISGLSTSDLLNPEVVVAAPVRCDEIAFQFLGVSMAGWNVIISLGLMLLWLAAARKSRA